MRSAVLASAAVLFAAGAGARILLQSRAVAAPLGCARVVAIESDTGVRIACPDDAALRGCADVREGVKYRGCEAVGVVRGAVLAAHGQPLDANRASADDFRALPGVGPGMAARIVEARKKRPICDAEDLDGVPGLGPKKSDALAKSLWFDPKLCTGHGAQ